MFGFASWTLKALCIDGNPYSMYRLPSSAKMLVTILLPPPENERQCSVNDL